MASKRGHLLHRLTVMTLALALGGLSLASCGNACCAEKLRVPNVVIILADDKDYTCPPGCQKTQKNRNILRFPPKFQIAGNCGQFMGIPGN